MTKIRYGRNWPYHAILIVFAMIVAIPLVWMLLGSVESMRDLFSSRLIPNRLVFGNYTTAFTSMPFLLYLGNSVFTTGVIVLCQLVTSSLAAFGMVFTRAPGKRIIFALVIVSLMIPIQAIFIPDYVILSDLHWIDTYEALIVPFVGTGFGIFFLRQAYLRIPSTLVEAMRMDGASSWTILWRLVIPNTKPSLVALGLLNGVFHYGYLFWPLLVTNTTRYRVIPVGLSYFTQGQPDQIQWNLLMAANVMAVLPMVLLFLWGQRYLVKGILAYAIKG